MAALVSDLFSVSGLVCVVTGGGTGIGKWTAEAFDANGAAKVFILGRRTAELQKVAKGAPNSTIIPVTCDVTNRESLQAAVAEIRKHTTFINVLVSNAGYLASTKFMKVPHEPGSAEDVAKFLWASEAEDKGVFDTNVESVYWLFTAFLTLLHAGNTEESSVYRQKEIDSQFIAVASLSGLLKKTLTGYMYNASKAACVHFAKGVSHDFAHLNIRANTICPGAFVTGMTDKFLPPVAEKRGGMPVETHPAGRTGTAEDVAGLMLFLASRAGAYMNGSVINIDGGHLSMTPSVT
ncbi:3-oxoacyl-[acyl-carrier-protein] FabG [Cyphellophora attinorum]|uniref:3-oxoacyl-[acyl-carrier-protein] FabG n=1 Tax=Cyphellophora attinorum TaxID=1664694 RepID=A0A0N1H5B0_9EURO|nr:3-oxoacyl-[acyl-carrier-protein] FabG [Phialophora attinorum]KPI40850.1 3-oxoacyl-[acyl-carrier-protein] FabG [Phialophora attinorum]